MRYDRDHESPDVIDRRGQVGPARSAGGASAVVRLLMPVVKSRFGLVGVVALLVGAGLLQMMTGGSTVATVGAPARTAGGDDETTAFVSFVWDDVQETYQRSFARAGQSYRRAKLVLFTGRTSTEGCGLGDAATGPFYCPADERAYLDLSFFRTLSQRLGAGGDFAQAYVVAHELGHHAQNLLGVNEHAARSGPRLGAEGSSVRVELMADCFAGVWAHDTQRRDLLESGDLEEGLRAAASIGDDTLQRDASGVVRPETFSHGTSAQRERWFRVGLESGRLDACDTFSAPSL